MKRLTIAALALLGAISVHGDQQPPQAQPQPQPDSPLVRAAKAAASKNKPQPKTAKKKIVITNDTLVKDGGHITTASATPAALPPATPDVNPLEKLAADQIRARQAAEAKSKKEAEEKQKTAAERANAMYEGDDAEGIYEDPATTEGRMQRDGGKQPAQPETMKPQQPGTMKVGKPPV